MELESLSPSVCNCVCAAPWCLLLAGPIDVPPVAQLHPPHRPRPGVYVDTCACVCVCVDTCAWVRWCGCVYGSRVLFLCGVCVFLTHGHNLFVTNFFPCWLPFFCALSLLIHLPSSRPPIALVLADLAKEVGLPLCTKQVGRMSHEFGSSGSYPPRLCSPSWPYAKDPPLAIPEVVATNSRGGGDGKVSPGPL